MSEKPIVYRKEKSISYDEKTGELHFHKTFYTLNEVKDAITIIEVNKTMEDSNE